MVSDRLPGLVPCTTDLGTLAGVTIAYRERGGTVKRTGVTVFVYCGVTVKKRLSLFDESANRAVFVFVAACFAVVASKINNLQVALFPFAFGECFFEVFFGFFDAAAVA